MKSITISNLKTELKSIAAKIRESRKRHRELHQSLFKAYDAALNKEKYAIECDIPRLSWDFRHKHIVYCLIRGRTMEQIEPKSYYPPNQSQVDELLAVYTAALKAEQPVEVPLVTASP